ncbi:MAG TPA: peptidoglycan DD-metalloendopeptidase family protein, partial [Burkholderiales bacterium]
RVGITESEGARDEVRDQLRDSERAISATNRELRVLAAKRSALQAQSRSLAQRRRQAESELGARRESLGRLLLRRYLDGGEGYMRLALSGRDPSQMARELHYYGYLSEAQARMMERLRDLLLQTRDLERQLEEKRAELASVESDQRARRSDLAKEQAAKRVVLARVSNRLREQRREVHGLERDEARLARLVQQIAKMLATTPGALRNEALPEAGAPERRFATLKGALRLPARGEVTNRFGAARPGGGPMWKGLFIRAPAGAEVRAVAGGRVVFADWLRGFGNLLILDHGDAYLTIYGNNESLLRQVGDVVRTGEVIATTGNSGGSQNSGIYFELRHEGRPFDPLRWVSLR